MFIISVLLLCDIFTPKYDQSICEQRVVYLEYNIYYLAAKGISLLHFTRRKRFWPKSKSNRRWLRQSCVRFFGLLIVSWVKLNIGKRITKWLPAISSSQITKHLLLICLNSFLKTDKRFSSIAISLLAIYTSQALVCNHFHQTQIIFIMFKK